MEIRLVLAGEKTNLFEAVVPGEGVVRRLLPASNKAPSIEAFEEGIPYGLPFSDIVKPAEDFPERIEQALHNAGIWTLEDLHSKGATVVRVLQSVYGVELSSLVQAAEKYEPIPKPKGKKKEITNG